MAFLMVLLMLSGAALAEETPAMQLHQIDIGIGDAYLLISGKTIILVDCGIDSDATGINDGLMNYLKKARINHIDAHIVTHYHDDHCGNITVLNRRYGKDYTVVYGPSRELQKRFQPLKNGTYRQMKDGDELDIGPFHIKCISPGDPNTMGTTNYDSLNFIVTFGRKTFLFTGDWVDWKVARRHPESMQKIDVLSFPHHGLLPLCIQGDTMRQWSPGIVLVPGKNRDDIKKFAQSSHCSVIPEVYSYHEGHVVLTSDGRTIQVHTQVKPGQFKYTGK